MKTVTVAWLLVTTYQYVAVLPAAVAGVGLRVVTTAYIF